MIRKCLLILLPFLASFTAFAATSAAPKAGVARSNYPRNAHHVVGGGGYAIELRNGEIWAWGNNQFGQLGIGNNLNQESPVREFTNASNWADINPGESHVLAVKADGTLWAWGRNQFGQLGLGDNIDRNIPEQIGFDNDWVTIGCGGNQSFAIKTNGTLWAWGDNSSGQLGYGGTSNVPLNSTPVQVGTASNWLHVAAGNNFTLALNSSGGMFTWGNDAFGQLGNGTSSAVFTPTQIEVNSKWIVIEAGADYAMAIKSNGSLFSWGKNQRGQLGNNSTSNASSPVAISSSLPWIGMSCGQSGSSGNVQHSIGLKADGSVWTWGDNTLGALGNTQNTSPIISEPTTIFPLVNNIVAVETGNGVSYIRDASGQVYAAGTDSTGALGNTAPLTSSPGFIPISVVPVSWSSISAGQNLTAALKSDGTIWMWGSNSNGQLGNGSLTPTLVTTATQIGTASNWKMITAGANHIMAINASGQLFAWGGNGNGQLGNGSTSTSVLSPILIPSTVPWISVSGGFNFSLGVKADGTLWSWGLNTSAQLGKGNTNNVAANLSPAQIGTETNWVFANAGNVSGAAVKADGTLWMWGDNAFGQLGKGNNSSGSQNYTPAMVSGGDWTCIGHGSGSVHVVALKSNGTLWSWGRNNEGQLGNGTNTVNVSNYSPAQIGNDQIWVLCSAGYNHSAALHVDGSPWTWGDNSSGQLGLGYFGNTPPVFSPTQVFTVRYQDPLDIVIDISCGWNHTGVVKDYRERVCVTGLNTSGQIGDGTSGSANNKNEFQCMVYAPPCIMPTLPTLSKNPNTNVCPATNTILSITSGNLNSATQWRWYADACGTNYLGTGTSLLVSPTSTRTYFVRGESGGCVTPGSCSSITVNVNPTVTPGIIISTAATTICAGNAVMFNATVTNGGTSPSYQWKVDGNNVGSNSSAYSTSSLSNGQVVTCVLSSNASCVSPATATSNALTMTVNNSVTPSISISTSTTSVCENASVVFTATPVNGGSSPAFQWKVNGNDVGTNSSTYTTSSLSNGQVVTCVLTSNANCASPLSATSNAINMTVTNCSGVPLTKLRNADCGKQNLALNAAVLCDPVAGATNYDFEFTNLSNNAVGVKTTTSNSVSLSSVTPAITFGTQYNVRVRAKVAGVYGNYGTVCVIGTVCNPSICGVPLTQLRASDCGKLNFSPLTGQVIADAVAAASQYEFEFRNISTNVLYATKLQSSNVLALNSVAPALQWNTQYNVKVRAYIAGVAGTYGTNCVIGFIPDPSIAGVPNTQLTTAFCGKTNLALTGSISCIAVTGAGSYEWEFKDQGNTVVVATKTTTGTSLNLSTVTGLNWNTQYNVRVRGYIGTVAGTYSVSCLIGLIPDPAISGVPATKIRTSDCGKLNFGLGGTAVADAVSGAAEYEFEIRNNSTNAFIANKIQPSNVLTFSTVPAFQWNTQYKISVRARISSTWGTFGTACTIGFICDPALCGVPNTALRTSDCGKLNFNLSSGYAVANTVAGANLYEFEITDLTTSSIVSVQERTNTNLFFNTITPALLSTKQYSIRVRATISGVAGAYGTACTIGFVSGSRDENGEAEVSFSENNLSQKAFELKVYPNPFNEISNVQIISEANEKVQVFVIDMKGNTVWCEQVNSNDIILLGQQLAKGNYFVKAIRSDGTEQVETMVKAE